MPKRKFALDASRDGKVNDEEIRKIEAVRSAPATAIAEKLSNGRAVSVPTEERHSRVLHEIKAVGRAKVRQFQIDPQTGHVVKAAVAEDEDGKGEHEED